MNRKFFMNFLTTTRRCPGLDMLLFLALISLASHGQAPLPKHSSYRRSVEGVEASGIAREIDDPSSGDRWLLVRSDGFPGGPGRLFLVSRDESQEFPPVLVHNPPAGASVPVIRAGDTLAVEEHTELIDARFEAIALGPARTGDVFRVRVKLGGAVLRGECADPH